MINICIVMLMSCFIAGLGIIYCGDWMKGFGIFLLWSILVLISIFSNGLISCIAGVLAIIVWIVNLDVTFNMFKNI